MSKEKFNHYLTKSDILVSVPQSEPIGDDGKVNTINLKGKNRKYDFSDLKPVSENGKVNANTLSERLAGVCMQRESTLMNQLIKEQVSKLIAVLTNKYRKDGLTFELSDSLTKVDIINYLYVYYGVDNNQGYFDDKIKSEMKPDGGILWMITEDGKKFPILISEMKSQGEGKIQPKGNAIERAGKNILGIETLLLCEPKITPMVIFAQGHDFAEGSSILGRASVLNNMQPLNDVNIISKLVVAEGGVNSKEEKSHLVRRFAFMARKEAWTDVEVYDTIKSVSEKAISHFMK